MHWGNATAIGEVGGEATKKLFSDGRPPPHLEPTRLQLDKKESGGVLQKAQKGRIDAERTRTSPLSARFTLRVCDYLVPQTAAGIESQRDPMSSLVSCGDGLTFRHPVSWGPSTRVSSPTVETRERSASIPTTMSEGKSQVSPFLVHEKLMS